MSDERTPECDLFASHLAPFADGELAEPMRSDVADHLRECAFCSQKVDQQRSIDALIAGLPRTVPSAGVFERTLVASRERRLTAVTRESLPRPGLDRVTHALRQAAAALVARPEDVADSDEDGETGDGEPDRGWDDAPTAPGTIHPPSGRSRRAGSHQRGLAIRRGWAAAVLPIAAVLALISISATLFMRLPAMSNHGAPSQSQPVIGDPRSVTQARVAAVAGSLAFAPVVPTYLPAGVGTVTTQVGPNEPVDASSRYLDITWTFTDGPGTTLRLRELPAGLGFDGFDSVSSTAARLQWQAPGQTPWLQLRDPANPRAIAMGQQRSTGQWALEVIPRDGASTDAASAWLRLVSLSLDLPYQALPISPRGPDSSAVLRFTAAVTDGKGGAWTWDATVVGVNAAQQRVNIVGINSNPADQIDQTLIVNSPHGLLRDNQRHTYQTLQPPLPSLLPPDSVTQMFYSPQAYLASGDLWNLGQRQVKAPDNTILRVYDLYRSNAVLPQHLYVDVTTGQVVAEQVDITQGVHPGGAGGKVNYVAANVCRSLTFTYTWIEFVPPSAISSATFDTTPPTSGGWSPTTISSPTKACAP